MIRDRFKTEFSKVQELMYELKVHDAMTERVVVACPETLMSELREMLQRHRISGVPVTGAGKSPG